MSSSSLQNCQQHTPGVDKLLRALDAAFFSCSGGVRRRWVTSRPLRHACRAERRKPAPDAATFFSLLLPPKKKYLGGAGEQEENQ
jgi:hypothetical protein